MHKTTYYSFHGEAGACGTCLALHGMAFPVNKASPGNNYPPIHPNCKCDVKPYHLEDALFADSANININPGDVSLNEWIFFGWDGDEFQESIDKIYTDEFFGKTIPTGNYNQTDVDMHLVDRIARILFHETASPKGQDALSWLILNRLFRRGYTTEYNAELTLYNIATAEEQFEVFQLQHNTREDQANPYRPLEWIKEYPSTAYNLSDPIHTKDSWAHCLMLAKMLVTAACNPAVNDPEAIRGIFEAWVPNPFNCNTPYEVFEYRADGYVSSGNEWEQSIGGNAFFIR